ncbi:MAG: hypothetical protein HZB57_01775 [Gammaproteobacteria bacterium]|nr:hypothetical protein [Gammaproteobacteria bacterium]
MQVSHTAKTALALLFMLLFISALGIYGWASGKAAAIVGPSHLAAAADSLYTYSGNELLHVSQTGALRGRWPNTALDLQYAPIDVRVLRDGRVLLAEQNPARLRACTTQQLNCEKIGNPIADKRQDQYKVFHDESTDTLLIADFKTGRLWRQPFGSGKPEALTDKGTLSRINDLALDDTGRIWVADSGHHRIVALTEDTNGKWRIDRSLDAKNSVARPGNDWPMMLALTDDGKLWAVQSNGTGQSADVLIYDPKRGAIARIALPEYAYPTDIVSLGASLVVSDMDNFRLYRIDAATRTVADFGGSDLSEILRAAQQNRQAYKARMTQMIAAMIVFGVLMIGAAIWATPAEKRWTRPNFAAPLAATATAAPDIKGIYWLKRNRNMDRLLTWAPVVLYGMLIVLGVLMFNLFATVDTTLGEHPSTKDLTTFTEFKHSMLLIMGFFAGIPILIHLGMQNMKRQLGTDGRRLYVRSPNGRELSFAPEQLVYGNRHIQYQDLIFPTQTNKGQPLYVAGEVETYIAPLLQQAKKLSALELLKYQCKYMEPVTMFTLVYIAITFGVAFTTGLWRNFLH